MTSQDSRDVYDHQHELLKQVFPRGEQVAIKTTQTRLVGETAGMVFFNEEPGVVILLREGGAKTMIPWHAVIEINYLDPDGGPRL